MPTCACRSKPSSICGQRLLAEPVFAMGARIDRDKQNQDGEDDGHETMLHAQLVVGLAGFWPDYFKADGRVCVCWMVPGSS